MKSARLRQEDQVMLPVVAEFSALDHVAQVIAERRHDFAEGLMELLGTNLS
jgi:hypothetical protein